MFTYVWGWSRGLRLGNPRTVLAKDEKAARQMIRERFNVRSTRGLSICVLASHEYERERLNAMGHNHPDPLTHEAR